MNVQNWLSGGVVKKSYNVRQIMYNTFSGFGIASLRNNRNGTRFLSL